jgi:hypothetical protein
VVQSIQILKTNAVAKDSELGQISNNTRTPFTLHGNLGIQEIGRYRMIIASEEKAEMQEIPSSSQ